MRIRKGIILLFSLFIFGKLFSQANDGQSLKALSVDSQFIDLVENSNSYKQYKVIELSKIKELKSSVLDTLKQLYGNISVDESEIVEQKSKIENLEVDLSNREAELNKTIEEKDSIGFFGANIEKNAFKTIFWSVVLLLILALLFFIYKYYHSQKVTVESKRELIEAHKELEEQRRKHIKKEQKIMRQLQDEINKNNR